jgi:hypothetical protein
MIAVPFRRTHRFASTNEREIGVRARVFSGAIILLAAVRLSYPVQVEPPSVGQAPF